MISQWGADGAVARGGPAQASAAGSVPPAGGVTTTVSETDDVAALLGDIPFNVSSLFLFNVSSQYWLSYTPGAPTWLNQPFTDNLDDGAIVWVRRSPSDTRGGIQWGVPAEAASLAQPQTMPVPPSGRVTAGAAGTTSVTSLLQAQEFRVRSVFAFDVAQQRFVSYTPGIPRWANTLPENGLQPSSVVWVARHSADVSTPPETGNALAAIGSLHGTSRNTPPSVAATGSRGSGGSSAGSAPAEGGTGGVPQGPSLLPTATPTPTPSPTATPKPETPTVAKPPADDPDMVSGAQLIRHLTFEGNDKNMPGTQAASGNIGETKESARSGSQAGFAFLSASDGREEKTGGFRAEYHGSDHTGEGSERWHGISFYLPDDYNQGSNSTWNDRIIFQFADEGSPMFSLHVDANREQFWIRRKLPNRDSDGKPQFETLARWDFSTERWYDFVFHVEWTQGNSGVFQVFVDGKQMVDYHGRTLAERDVTYSKWGIYGQPTRVLFDEVWVAEGSGTLESVRP